MASGLSAPPAIIVKVDRSSRVKKLRRILGKLPCGQIEGIISHGFASVASMNASRDKEENWAELIAFIFMKNLSFRLHPDLFTKITRKFETDWESKCHIFS